MGCAPVMIVIHLNLYSPHYFLTSGKSCLCRFWQKLTETDRSWQKDADFDREAICVSLLNLIHWPSMLTRGASGLLRIW